MYAPPAKASTSLEDPIRIADWIELNLLTQETSVVSIDDATSAIATDPPDASATSEHRQDYPDDLGDLDPVELREGYWEEAGARPSLHSPSWHSELVVYMTGIR